MLDYVERWFCVYYVHMDSFLTFFLPFNPCYLHSFLPFFFLFVLRVCLVPPGLFLSVLKTENFLMTMHLSNGRTTSVVSHLSGIIVLQCLLSNILITIDSYFYLFALFLLFWVLLGGKVSPNCAISFWLRAEVPQFPDLLKQYYKIVVDLAL